MATKKSHGRSHGFKHKSRSVMTKKQQALIIIDPRQHKGLPHRRYHGKVGVVTTVGRRTVILDVKLGNKSKTLITRLDHVKPFGV
jgi:large subunit ribosomal protein L21e